MNVLAPFSTQLSCLFSLGQSDKVEMQGKARGAIPWSQKSFEIFVPLSGRCSGDKSFISASVHLSSWMACLSFICAVLDWLCLVTGSFWLCQEQPSEQTHFALLSLLRLPQRLWRTPHTPSVNIINPHPLWRMFLMPTAGQFGALRRTHSSVCWAPPKLEDYVYFLAPRGNRAFHTWNS